MTESKEPEDSNWSDHWPQSAQIENPDLFPAWVWIKPPEDFDAPRLRGGLFFDDMAQIGFRVQIVPAGTGGDTAQIAIRRPWTFIVCNLPAVDFSATMKSLADKRCSVIMDCHFPIMNMETATGTTEQLSQVLDNKPLLLANLAVADVVTVPHPKWAADLADVNPNVHILANYDEENPDIFIVRLVEIAQASILVKRARRAARREMES